MMTTMVLRLRACVNTRRKRILVGMLWLGMGRVGTGDAQSAPPIPGRLTVRPHAMTLGTANPRSGVQVLDSANGIWVYVPKQAVGRRRVPLLVFTPSVGRAAWLQHVADTYGMILLWVHPAEEDLTGELYNRTLTLDPGLPEVVRGSFDDRGTRLLDAALQTVLRTYAIDPDRIAIAGNSNGAGYALFIGCNNLDIFSRVAAFSPNFAFDGVGPQRQQTQFFLLGGLKENGFFLSALEAEQRERLDGHSVELVLTLRSHREDHDEYLFMGRWLTGSWAKAGSVSSLRPQVKLKTLPVLTEPMVGKMVAFWTQFMQEPDSIKRVPAEYRRETTIPIGADHALLIAEDIPALAKRFPVVAADLKAAGLTAEQAEQYRLALVSARATAMAGDWQIAGKIDRTSTLGQNVAFLETHPNVLVPLGLSE